MRALVAPPPPDPEDRGQLAVEVPTCGPLRPFAMDQPASFHQRTVFRIGAVLATLLLLALGAWWQQRSMAAQREALVAQLAADHAAYLARDDRREVLYGEPQPGNAWEAYAKAIGLASDPAMQLRDDRLFQALEGTHTPSDTELAAWQEALQALRSGTHRQNARSLVDLRAGYHAALLDLTATLDLGRAAVVTARQVLASGATRAGLEQMLDALTFAVDLCRSPVLLEQMLGAVVLDAIATLGLTDQVLTELDRSELEFLATTLAIADSQTPHTVDPHGEALWTGSMLIDFKPGDQLPGVSIWHTWRHGFSVQRLALDALHEGRRLAQAVADDRSPDWPQREARLQEFASAVQSSDNVLLRMVATNHLEAERELRRAVADLRLLRLCVAERLGQGLELKDPLGSGNLQRTTKTAEDHPTVQFASAGTSSERVLVRTVVK